MENFTTDVKITKALDYASGTAVRNGAIIDMEGYEGVVVAFQFATIAASGTNSIKWQQDTAVGGGTMADLLGTSISVAADDDNQIFWSELVKPRERYVRCVMTKDASNACAESAIYYRYGAKKVPVDNLVDDTITGELHVSPAEGTA